MSLEETVTRAELRNVSLHLRKKLAQRKKSELPVMWSDADAAAIEFLLGYALPPRKRKPAKEDEAA